MMKYFSAFLLLGLLAVWGAQGFLDCPKQIYDSACSIVGKVTFKSWNGNTPAACGVNVPFADLANAPVIDWPGLTDGDTYTILMLDADYTYLTHKGFYYLLWALTNVPVAGGKLALDQGTTLAPYSAPDLSLNPGVHRIVILIFKHIAASQRISEPIPEILRARFNVPLWVYRYRNILTCVPVGGFQVTTRL